MQVLLKGSGPSSLDIVEVNVAFKWIFLHSRVEVYECVVEGCFPFNVFSERGVV